MKICKTCKIEKSDDNFYIDPRYKSGHAPECKSCKVEYRKQWNKIHKESNNLKSRMYDLAHPEEKRIRNKNYYEKNKEKSLAYSRIYSRNKTYGITEEIYNTILNKQGGGCAICGLKETAVGKITKRVKPLSVDHDHNTGKIRGLLCEKCNHGLGWFMDNKELLINAVNYLERVPLMST